ncbi:hypothetical protein [Flavobacterium sedimenticola]|uniref:DarT domain-containing protein n=1 Tax=Flavobacterium sedimenticola TaxID=3043286 RepID=A0ABT6XQZ3_9FLAO|nr:hypothetical protein [Flavobacterium sedimenticola]MDI9257267.1 hypothetical protein [Flavobacterium sedimenticola]
MNLYHYTTELKINEIINSGVINLSHANVYLKREKACAWVSSNPVWENTASKQVLDENGNIVSLTFEEQAKSLGCARIKVKPNSFYTWAKLKHLAKMDLFIAKRMEIVGIELGAKPEEWFGSLYPIRKENWEKIEVFRDGEWVEYSDVKLLVH